MKILFNFFKRNRQNDLLFQRIIISLVSFESFLWYINFLMTCHDENKM
jgi:hypothetical protein